MKEIRQSLPWLQILLALVAFVAVFGFSFLFWEQIENIVLVPILYLFWLADLAIKSFGYQCIWLVALMITIFLSLAFSRRTGKNFDVYHTTVGTRSPPVGRVQFWRRRIWVDSTGIHTLSFRHLEIQQLLIRALAYRESSSVEEIEERLRSGQLDIPAEVSYFFRKNGQTVEAHQPMRYIERIGHWFGWVRKQLVPPRFSPDPKIVKVAEYLESLLEVDHDVRNQ